MNLIEESFQKKEEKKNKKTAGIILGAIVVVILIIIAIIAYLGYLENKQLKVYLDGQLNDKLLQILVVENGEVKAPIKEIASYFGYESYNGEYTEKSEVQSKCYVQNASEVANLALNSTEIYKLDLTSESENYECENIKTPVEAKNGVLYTTQEGLEKTFNISFQYDQEKNRIRIYTLDYLIKTYTATALDLGYEEISSEFANQKAILQDMLVVKKAGQEKYGVIDLEGNQILEPKYDNIEYMPVVGDFFVTNNNKVGIISKNGETKVQLMYDSIELIDQKLGLYLAKKDGKYGVLDKNGNIKIHIENDEIGIDIANFTQNNIKNKYILVDNLIPARKDKYWGLYDVNGKLVVDYKYDKIGYTASNNKNAFNLLEIPDYNVLVVCKDNKYTLVNSSGQELFATVADDIYMTISGGEKNYYISVNDNQIDAEKYLDDMGVSAKNTNSNTNTNNSNSTNTTNTTNTTQDTEDMNNANSGDTTNDSNTSEETTVLEGQTSE